MTNSTVYLFRDMCPNCRGWRDHLDAAGFDGGRLLQFGLDSLIDGVLPAGELDKMGLVRQSSMRLLMGQAEFRCPIVVVKHADGHCLLITEGAPPPTAHFVGDRA